MSWDPAEQKKRVIPGLARSQSLDEDTQVSSENCRKTQKIKTLFLFTPIRPGVIRKCVYANKSPLVASNRNALLLISA